MHIQTASCHASCEVCVPDSLLCYMLTSKSGVGNQKKHRFIQTLFSWLATRTHEQHQRDTWRLLFERLCCSSRIFLICWCWSTETDTLVQWFLGESLAERRLCCRPLKRYLWNYPVEHLRKKSNSVWAGKHVMFDSPARCHLFHRIFGAVLCRRTVVDSRVTGSFGQVRASPE